MDSADEIQDSHAVFLWEQRNSAHFKTFVYFIQKLYDREAACLTSAKPEYLLRHQGILLGLQFAKNLLTQAKIPE